jgi:hypothetical protein
MQPIHALEKVTHVLETILDHQDAAVLMEHVALMVFIASTKLVWLTPKEENATLPPIVLLISILMDKMYSLASTQLANT